MKPSSCTLGISFLARAQQSNGSYLSYSSSDPTTFQNQAAYPTTFTTALILDCLASCPRDIQADRIKKKIVTFLVSQKSEHGSFNYWDRLHSVAQKLPYPDDLDDTFCALSAMHRAMPELTTGETLAQSVTLLTHSETEEGGPYKTWLVPDTGPSVWQDVDLAVNNNIAYFLSLQGVVLPSLTALTEVAIRASEYSSRYYPNEYPLFYFISRWYSGELQSELAGSILSRQNTNGSWGSPLTTALAVTSLVRLKVEIPRLAEVRAFLHETQNHDGSWNAEPFCYDPMIQGVQYYAGAPALTTAFCLEALAITQPSKALPVSVHSLAQYRKLSQSIERAAYARARSIPVPLRSALEEWILKICTKDKDGSIRLLSKIFYDCLVAPEEDLEDSYFVTLGQASIFGWIAYSLYDDFLDDEGDIRTLPVANVALREVVNLFARNLPQNLEFHKNVIRVLDLLEAANAWEVMHCRVSTRATLSEIGRKLPDYGDLSQIANRSLGHALGAMAILSRLGYVQGGREMKRTEAFFRHYIIARQLNDDAHDWQDDLARGHLTAVVTQLLRSALVTLSPRKQERPVSKIMPQLEDLFWRHEILRICDTIDDHLAAARSALKSNSAVNNPSGLLRLLEPIEESIRKARETHRLTTDFLITYTTV